ncbi:MAG TPA: glycosyltransferase, partial [Marmoricola sp.]|nr:glycosyltransferase [Marmoricola sp.]
MSSADQHSAQSQRSATTIIVIPTYNEADNIAAVTSRLRDAAPLVDILIVDDNSPDGTGEIAEQLASVDSAISVMHRASKEGLGAAYIAGFREA